MAEHKMGAASTFLKPGEMKRVDLEGKAVVVVRVGDEYFAIGGNCTHYGAHLDEGVLKGHMLICPWHHACFDVRSGARLEPPALNDARHYAVRIEDGQVVVSFPHDNQQEPQGKADSAEKRHFVIVGGGAVGNAAAEELRRSGFKGKITILSAVQTTPVDRPNLSKDYLSGHAEPAWIPLRDEKWYAAREIDLRLNTNVTKVNPKEHSVTLENGETVHYDKLLLGTGGMPRQLKGVPGNDLKGVFLLRTLADADAIIAACGKGKKAVIIGSSFIGLEGAASLGERGVSVTVVGMESVPFEHILGPDIGAMFQKEHEGNGVQFRLKSEIKQFVGKDGQVTGVELKSGETLPADFAVLGIGVSPATDVLDGSEITLHQKDHSVQVSGKLQTSEPDIFAAGDIARWDDGSSEGQRIEHWRTAQQQGVVAARNMLGGSEDFNNRVPFFWTHQWKVELRYVGHADKWDVIIFRGKPEGKKFIAFYVTAGKLKAAAGIDHDQDIDAVELILRDKRQLSTEQMRNEKFDLVTYAIGG